MNITKVLREIMKQKGIKLSMLCDRLNIKSSVLSERFKQSNMSILKLNEMLRAMDYKIIVVPRETRIPLNGYELCTETIYSEPLLSNEKTPKIDLDSLLSEPPKHSDKKIKLVK